MPPLAPTMNTVQVSTRAVLLRAAVGQRAPVRAGAVAPAGAPRAVPSFGAVGSVAALHAAPSRVQRRRCATTVQAAGGSNLTLPIDLRGASRPAESGSPEFSRRAQGRIRAPGRPATWHRGRGKACWAGGRRGACVDGTRANASPPCAYSRRALYPSARLRLASLALTRLHLRADAAQASAPSSPALRMTRCAAHCPSCVSAAPLADNSRALLPSRALAGPSRSSWRRLVARSCWARGCLR